MSGDETTVALGGEDALPALSEDAACEIINTWSASGFFRLRNMGEKIFYDEIVRGVAYTIRVQTHYERRIVQKTSVPFHGGEVDDRGRPPLPWEMPVARPAPFEERTDVLAIPHTERVQMCSQCAGQGRVTCPQCAGQGRVTCSWCGGRGFVEQQVLEPARDAAGNTTMITRAVERPCSCSGGMVVCSTCHGNRMLTCSSCAGSGSVKTFDQLIVRFQAAAQGELLDVTPVPDRWLAKLAGELLIDERTTRIDGCNSLPEAATRKVMELLAKSHEVDEREYRIILQQLHVERIPIHEVRYKYAGVERQLWICGNEQSVYAPKAPWNRTRFFWLVTGCVLAVAAAVGAAIWQWQ